MQSVNNLTTQLSVQGAQQTTQQLNQVASAFANVGKAADQASKNTNFTTAILGTASAAGAIRVIDKLSSSYANLVNARATAEAVFDGSGFEVIEEAAEDAARAFGLSNQQFIEGATLIAGLGKSSGLAGTQLAEFSVGITRLATDLGAAFNTSTLDAIKAIQSGFSGSSIEPLRRYNIVINDTALKQEYLALTGEKVTTVLSNQQRQLAFVSLLTKQSADYTGQWEREQGSLLATQQIFNAELEDFTAALGSGVTPALTTATAAATDALQVFGRLPEWLQRASGAAAGGTAAWLGMRGALQAVEYAADRSGGKFQALTTRAMPALTAGANALGIAIAGYSILAAASAQETERLGEALEDLGASASVGAASKALADFSKDGRSNLAKLSDLAQTAIPGLWGALMDNDEMFQSNRRRVLGIKDLTEALEDAGDPAVTAGVLRLAEANAGYASSLDNIVNAPSADELRALYDEQIASAAAAANAQSDVNAALEAAQWGLGTTADKVEIAAGSYEDLADAIEEVGDRAEDARERVDDLIDAAFESVNRRFDSAIALQSAIEGLEKFAELSASGESTALDLLNEQKDIQESISDIVAGRVADAEALYGKLGAGAEIDLTRQIFDDLRTELGPEAASFIDAIEAEFEKSVPKMRVDVGIADADLGTQVRALIDQQSAQGREQIIVDVLTEYAGLDGDQIADVLSRIPADKRKLVLTTALDTAEAAGKLDDDEFVASLIVDASFDEAYESLDEFTNDPLVNDINAIIKANLTSAEADMRQFRKDNGTLDVKVRLVGSQGDTFGGGGVSPGPRSEGVERLAEPAAASTGFSSPVMVVARRPVAAGNTYVTINPPPGMKADEVIASIDKWRRRNGGTTGPWR